jgi:hypothetical protein
MQDRISVRALVAHTGEHGLMFLLLIFALFCAIPLPIPGIHVFLSMPLFYVTGQMMMGRKTIWFPEKILNATLPRSGFVAMIDRAEPWFDRLDNLLRPRLTPLTAPRMTPVIGAVAFFITCIIVIPLPLTNVVPALSIALIALGAQCRDGVAVLVGITAGLLWCLAWIALALALGWAGMKGIYALVFH